jgi:hypothetical protein
VEIACQYGALNLLETLIRSGARLTSTNSVGNPVWFDLLQFPPQLPFSDHPTTLQRLTTHLPANAQSALRSRGILPAGPSTRQELVLPWIQRLGVDVTRTGSSGRTALHALTRAKSGSVPLELVEFYGHFGAREPEAGPNSRAERLRTLLAAGLSLEARDSEGNTPWLLAVQHLDLETATLLADAGANHRATNAAGQNALHLVCAPNPSGGADWTTTNAPPRFIGPLIGELVKQGVDPRAADRDGRTPLHLGVARFHPIFVAVELVEAGADPNARDLAGRTPMQLAEELGRADLVRFFKDPVGANPLKRGPRSPINSPTTPTPEPASTSPSDP